MFKDIIDYVKGTVVECNTAYEGERDTTEKHLKLIKKHGWSDFYKFDLMDAEGPDMVLDIPNGKVIKKNYLGRNLEKYNSMLVLSHFKGHPMGGFGGALKQLSIGVASSYGKMHIHTAGSDKEEEKWTAPHDKFLESMADAASSVVKHFNGNIAFINVMMNMSVDCDCCAIAEDPCLKDIGVLASLDPIAIDQACIDLPGRSSRSCGTCRDWFRLPPLHRRLQSRSPYPHRYRCRRRRCLHRWRSGCSGWRRSGRPPAWRPTGVSSRGKGMSTR